MSDDDLSDVRLGPTSFHRGLHAVDDGDRETRSLVTVLDLQERQPGVSRLRRWAREALDPRPGETVVDVGCGTGSEAAVLAELVGPSGRVVGIEPHPGLRAEAVRRVANAGVEVVDGDALALPFADASVDVLRCERVWQHLTDPVQAAREVARVLAPGGRAAILDSDWGTTALHPEDAEVRRRYEQWRWSQQVNPFAGRHLRAQLREAGLVVDPDIGSSALVFPPEALVTGGPLRGNLEDAVAAGVVTAEEGRRMFDDVAEAARRGEAFLAVTMFAVVGRRSTPRAAASAQPGAAAPSPAADPTPDLDLTSFQRPTDTQAEPVAGVVAFLDRQERQPAFVRLRDWAVGMVDPRPGETAVDVGCGTGGHLRRLAELVGPAGRAVGVEPNPWLRRVAEERLAAGSGAAVVDGTATALPFPDASVDVVHTERVWQHLPDCAAAAAEIARVLRPGGRVAVIDTDWGTVVCRAGAPDLVRRLYDAVRRSMPEPLVGRHLRRLLGGAGLEVDHDIGSSAFVLPEVWALDPGSLGPFLRLAIADGGLSRAEADRLHAELIAAAAAGTGFLAATMFAAVARKPSR